eukprot:TRINITY_DN2711_c0_g1_i2.p1 TRINITY_DN2711_c0_g1~~TRINITY_DN2711_c0_g1_i2.p1  ORF type:complete len:345 (+),score=37.34 TRINITY_DN2711_c0_g1_i2:162-1196(+)
MMRRRVIKVRRPPIATPGTSSSSQDHNGAVAVVPATQHMLQATEPTPKPKTGKRKKSPPATLRDQHTAPPATQHMLQATEPTPKPRTGKRKKQPPASLRDQHTAPAPSPTCSATTDVSKTASTAHAPASMTSRPASSTGQFTDKVKRKLKKKSGTRASESTAPGELLAPAVGRDSDPSPRKTVLEGDAGRLGPAASVQRLRREPGVSRRIIQSRPRSALTIALYFQNTGGRDDRHEERLLAVLQKELAGRAWTADDLHNALCYLASQGFEAPVRLLLDRGAPLNHTGHQSPLHVAGRHCHVEVCKLLLDRGEQATGLQAAIAELQTYGGHLVTDCQRLQQLLEK